MKLYFIKLILQHMRHFFIISVAVEWLSSKKSVHELNVTYNSERYIPCAI